MQVGGKLISIQVDQADLYCQGICISKYQPLLSDILNTLQKAFRPLCPLPSPPVSSVMTIWTGAQRLPRSLSGSIAT